MDASTLPEVIACATRVREFLEPFFAEHPGGKCPSEGHCFPASHALASALCDTFGAGTWLPAEGMFANEDVKSRIQSGELYSWSKIEDAAGFHGFVVSADRKWIADVTADQFDQPKIVVLSREDAESWLVRYCPLPIDDRSDFDRALVKAMRNGDTALSAWTATRAPTPVDTTDDQWIAEFAF